MIEIKPIEQDDIPGALASERELRRQEPDETSRANGRIKTERLTLRRVRAADRADIRAIWADAARSVYAQYDRPNDLDEPAVSRRIERWASFADSGEHVFLAVCLQERVVGYLGLHAREEGYELGYCFHSDYHGRGYARESVAAVLEILREKGVSRVTAGTALNNTPSVRLLTALGFRLTGTETVSFYKDDAGRDITFTGGLYERILSSE